VTSYERNPDAIARLSPEQYCVTPWAGVHAQSKLVAGLAKIEGLWF